MEKINVIIYENNKEIETLHLRVIPNIGDAIKTENGFFRVKERVIYTHPKCDTEDIMISVERLTKNPITGEFDHNGMVEYLERKKEEIVVEAEETRKIIYTTNPIESLNSALRKVTRGKGSFINEMALLKVLYLRVENLEKKWS